ncbi:MAG TPA: alpha/beta fold hydrolase [Pyrinomonadaceae bacterium]|nr:alpha/beta fold hydrolase [Pyrinomonadaceae bacterium]
MKVESGFAEIGGARLFYEQAGEGDALVLVHAGIADARMWDEQFQVFARSFRVVRYDRRGFGRTRASDGSARFSHHEDLYNLLRFLEIERAIFVGCSQGGKTVMDLTLEHAEVTRALVLVASALGGFEFKGDGPRQLAELERADEAGDVERVNELELQIWVDGPHREPHEVDARVRERVREMNRIALSASQSVGTEQPLEPPAIDRLGEIRVPTLVVTGDLDTPKTLAAARVLSNKISGAQSVVIHGTAHLPNMERPEEFNRHVLSFLSAQ